MVAVPASVRIGRLHGTGAQRRRAAAPGCTARNPLARSYAAQLAETLRGVRPLHRFAPLGTDAVRAQLHDILGRRRFQEAALGQVHDHSPAPHVLEVSTTLRDGSRCHPIAFRLEQRVLRRSQPQQWVVTALHTPF